MAKKPKAPKDKAEIEYPYPPHEFIVPRGLLPHLSPMTQDELKSLAEARKIKFID